MKELEGKVAIVTGAAGNIGSVTAAALAEAGAKVVLTDVAEQRLKEIASGLQSQGFEAIAVVADIMSEEQVKAVIDAAISTYGGVDILDNNAGGTMLTVTEGDRDVTTMNVELWDKLMAVNLRGPMLFCKYCVPSMVARGGGSIINISSGTSLAGNDANTAYACSKGGLNTLTKYVATAHGSQGVRCNALALGIVVPEDMPPMDALKPYVAHKLVGRTGYPSDIANMVVFLASGRSAFITGQVISVDGGFFAHQPTFTNKVAE
ncbi:MAG: hypothetical protein VR73_01570 [Gammaproteobacteria bacterium BRH_c0]|nr:MAG: hypothetical protein VR73_01570 [Gammaproteobacteria bacterium BRH_c0]